MEHYYAECFGYMPPAAGYGNRRDVKYSAHAMDHDYGHSPLVPRRPMTLQFGTDTQFLNSKDAPPFVPDYALLFPLETQEDLQHTITPVAIEEPLQMRHVEHDFHSPLSPSSSSSASSYARSFSDCSPPPSGGLLANEYGYLPDMQADRIPDIDEAFFADLSNIETQICLGPSDQWATLNCQELSAPNSLGESGTPDGSDAVPEMYHEREQLSTPPAETASDSSSADNGGIQTIIAPSSATPCLESDSPARTKPRVISLLGEKNIEGQGLCYVYSDGTHCPKYVKGEPVNAKWGVTKAGKPRRRLAQACIACRHRKIKCNPGSPKCEQCRRSGKACRFENAPRGNLAKQKAESESRPGCARSHRRSASEKDGAVKDKPTTVVSEYAAPTDFSTPMDESWSQ